MQSIAPDLFLRQMALSAIQEEAAAFGLQIN